MTLHVNDGGVFRTVNGIYINDGGVLRHCNDVYINDGGVLRHARVGGDIIRLDAAALSSVTVGGVATCSFRIDSDGGIYFNQANIPGGGFIKQYDWVLPNANAGLYECRWTSLGNDPSSPPGVADTWLACTTDRTWANSVNGSSDTSSFTCELRLASNPGVTLKSVVIQLNPDGSP